MQAAKTITAPVAATKNVVQRKVHPAVSAPSKQFLVSKTGVLQRQTSATSLSSSQPSRQPVIQLKPAHPSAPAIIQTSLQIGAANDSFEQEANRTADRVMATPATHVATPKASATSTRPIARKASYQTTPIALVQGRRINRQSATPSPAMQAFNLESKLANSAGRGAPLSDSARAFMEPRFGADFSAVRVHTAPYAVQMNNALGSHAFAYQNNLYFNQGQYQPDTAGGRHLLAHELTHVVQQGAAVQRKPDTSVTLRTAPLVQGLGISDVLDYFADKANNIPGFALLTFVIGVNPINMSAVPRTPANLFRGVIGLIPGGNLIFEALQNHGIVDKVGNWMMAKFSELGMAASAFRQGLDQFLDSLSWTDIFDLGDVWDRAVRIFTVPVDRIISFIGSLVSDIIKFIKEAILRPIAALANGTRGYDLLKAVLGEDPVTGEPVPRTAETLIGGFMKLIGQEEIWENIKKSNAIGRAWSWFQGALGGLMGFVRQIPATFINAFRSLEITDIILVPRAFAKIVTVFGNFIGSFLSWAGNTIWDLLQIIFSVVAPAAMPYLQRAAGAFRSILQNPIGFVGNLVRAAMLGFRQFASRFLVHMRNSLLQWLTGALPGVYIPQALNLREIIKFVLSVLGLTWANIRGKLVRAVGETSVVALETGFDIVRTLVTQGPAAAWEKLMESLSNLQQMVIDSVMEFVRSRIVEAAVTRLLSMLSPAGAFIQAIIAIYNTIMFFVERLRQIAQVAASFIDSISAIASGSLANAANRVEQTMGGLLTLVISFLARIAGLGRVSDAVMNIINRVRQPIDRALDRVIEWIVAAARRLGRFVAQAGVPNDPNERLRLGMGMATAAANRFAGRRVGAVVLNPLLAGIKVRYAFTTLEVVANGTVWDISGEINPRSRARTNVQVEGAAGAKELTMPLMTIAFRVKPDIRNARDSGGVSLYTHYVDQLRLQENRLRSMKINRWLTNIQTFYGDSANAIPRQGRSREGDRRAEQIRARLVADKMRELMAAPYNLTREVAAVRAQQAFSEQAVLHLLDQGGGGSGTEFVGDLYQNGDALYLGNARVDFSIGAAWPTRARELRGQIESRVDTTVFPTENMNVRLNPT